MRTNSLCSLAAIAASLCFQPFAISAARAQDNPASPEESEPADDIDQLSQDDIDTIVISASRLLNRVDAAQRPLLELDEEDIAAYGAGSIAELVQQLGPQLSSSRSGGGGQPVILVNGVRIGSFRELRSYPPEAIERTEVFSEEVAQQYGFSPDQRVVNIILKDNYQSYEIEGEYGQPFDGGFSEQEIEATYLRIDGTARLNANLEYNTTSTLTESERDIIAAESSEPGLSSDPDPADFRSLIGESSGFEATVNWTSTLDKAGTSLAINGTFERDDTLSLQGLDTVLLTDPDGNSALRSFNVTDPLTVDRRSDTYSTAVTLNGNLGDWQVTTTLDASLADSVTRTQRQIDTGALLEAAAAGELALDADLGMFPEAGFEESDSQTYTINALATARGKPIFLPGGDVSATLIAGYRGNGIRSTDTRDLATDIKLDRSRFQAGLNVSIPLTSRETDFGGVIGDVSLNFSGDIRDQSDFGTLFNGSAGVNWGIFGDINLSATFFYAENSPSLSQLGAPNIETPNVPVFDFVNNETVFATFVSGGNPDLPVQRQNDWKFAINWGLPFVERGGLQIEYSASNAENISSGFPVLTPAIDAAFPGRVQRDMTGRLARIDQRPVSFAEQNSERVRIGLNLFGQFGGGSGEARGGENGGEGSGEGSGGRSGSPAARPGAGQNSDGEGRPAAGQFAEMRAQFCEADPEILLERFNAALDAQRNGTEPPTDDDGNAITVPPQMLERLAGEDGRISAERLATLREQLCSTTADGSADAGGGERARGSGRGRGGSRSGGGFISFGGGDGPPVARWFANMNYVYELENTVLIADGIPRLDLLNGDAISGSGQPRHSLQWTSGLFYDGFGGFLFANYRGESDLNGSGLPGSTDLSFSDVVTVDLRTFVDLGQRDSLVEAAPFFRNARIGFDIVNIFDARQRVIDSAGETPLRFQPFFIDPRGRSLEIEFRKLF